VDAWLERARDVLAETAGLAPDELELDPAAVATLLDLARIAAHESGKRTNAPLLCYLVGRATAHGASLDAVADALRRG
jgi:hypothetical protein